MILETGAGGVTALWTNAYFLALVVVAGTLTRTVSVYAVVWAVLAGGFLMTVMLVLARVFLVLEPDRDALLRDFVIPAFEDLMKVAPVLLVLWLGRRRDSWSLGATDVLLIATASGIGFGVVEDAFIRANSGWPEEIPFLPVVEIIGGRTIAGHGIWAGLAGATLGLGLLLRGWRPLALVLAVAGFAWSALDHITNNLGILKEIGGLTVPLFLIAAAGCIAVDLYVRARTLPPLPELQAPPLGGDLDALARAWEFRLLKRALAFAVFRYRTSTGSARVEAEVEAQRLMDGLGYPPDPGESIEAGAPLPPVTATADGGAA
jgi:RsiW-degrading membrane proteinase PrsW (M82 family)